METIYPAAFLLLISSLMWNLCPPLATSRILKGVDLYPSPRTSPVVITKGSESRDPSYIQSYTVQHTVSTAWWRVASSIPTSDLHDSASGAPVILVRLETPSPHPPVPQLPAFPSVHLPPPLDAVRTLRLEVIGDLRVLLEIKPRDYFLPTEHVFPRR